MFGLCVPSHPPEKVYKTKLIKKLKVGNTSSGIFWTQYITSVLHKCTAKVEDDDNVCFVSALYLATFDELKLLPIVYLRAEIAIKPQPTNF